MRREGKRVLGERGEGCEGGRKRSARGKKCVRGKGRCEEREGKCLYV